MFTIFCLNILWVYQKTLPLHSQMRDTPSDADGAIAQLVEQRTENPCVPGSIPGGTTSKGIAQYRKNIG